MKSSVFACIFLSVIASSAHAQSVGYKVVEATETGISKYFLLPTTSRADFEKAQSEAKNEAHDKSIIAVVEKCNEEGGLNLFDVCIAKPIVTAGYRDNGDFFEVQIRATAQARAVCVFAVSDETDFEKAGLSRERPVLEDCIPD